MEARGRLANGGFALGDNHEHTEIPKQGGSWAHRQDRWLRSSDGESRKRFYLISKGARSRVGVVVLTPLSRQQGHRALALQSKRRSKAMTRKEMRASAYEKLMEAMRLLASAGLPLLSEEVEELALQVDLQTAD